VIWDARYGITDEEDIGGTGAVRPIISLATSGTDSARPSSKHQARCAISRRSFFRIVHLIAASASPAPIQVTGAAYERPKANTRHKERRGSSGEQHGTLALLR
jgi:hypothetical protein